MACNIEASVVTGFEHIAARESEEKLGILGKVDRGRIFLDVPFDRVKEVLQLRCVDNLFVVVKRIDNCNIPQEKCNALSYLKSFCDDVDWRSGLLVWKQFFDYPHSVDEILSVPKPADVDTIENKAETDTKNASSTASQSINSEKCQQVTNTVESRQDDVQSSRDASIPASVASAPSFPPRFRVTCNRTGAAHSFSSMEAAAEFGGKVQDTFNWVVKMKGFHIEVVLNIDEQQVYICLALTTESLHRRNISHFGPTTLRSTIAHGMLRLCELQAGDVICDPMCGGGTIPIECSLNWTTNHVMCGDNHEQARTRTLANVTVLNDKRARQQLDPAKVDMICWDITRLPLRSNSVDVFVTDLPFGKRCGSRGDNRILYRLGMLELARCCKQATGRAVLLTQDKRTLLNTMKLDVVSALWRKCHTRWVNVGGLNAAVYVLRRTVAAPPHGHGSPAPHPQPGRDTATD